MSPLGPQGPQIPIAQQYNAPTPNKTQAAQNDHVDDKSKPEVASVKKGLQERTIDRLYSVLSYSSLSWLAIALLMGYLYMQKQDKAPFRVGTNAMDLTKAAMVMNGILVVIFYLAVTLYKPMDTTPIECKLDDKKASFTKFVGLLSEVGINVLPLILTGFLGYHCLLSLHNIATVAFIPAVIFLIYHSIMPVDKIYINTPDVQLDSNSGSTIRTKGSIMSIVPPTLAVYSLIVGLYYLIHK